MSAVSLIRSHLLKCKVLHANAKSVSGLCKSASISVSEVSKFNEIKNWWADEQMKPLRAMNELRVPLVVNHLSPKQTTTANPLNGYNLLDVGCGGGLLCEPLARLGANVTGIDANAGCIQYCNDRLNSCSSELKPNLKFINTTVEEFATKENCSAFDAVIASEVLEHIEDVESVIQSCNQLLKTKGLFFITTINQTVIAYLLAIFGAEKLLRIVPEGMHDFDKLVPYLGLKIMLEKNNFDVKLTHGLSYNPLSKRWSWTTNTLVSYAIIAQKSN